MRRLTATILAAMLCICASARAQTFGTNTGTFVYWLPTYGMDQLPLNIGQYGQGYNNLPGGVTSGAEASTIIGNVGFYAQAQNYASGAGYTIRFNAPNPAAINLSVGGMFSGLSNVQISGSAYTATFSINHDGGNPLAGGGEVDLAGASTSNAVTNFSVTRPGGTVGAMTPVYQSFLGNYQAVRWMNNNNINNNVGNITAADLMPSGQNFGSSAGNFGNSYDDIIRASNDQANLKTVWINIPTNADDSFVKAVADKFATKLNAGKDVVVEYSNEPWNFAFSHPGQIYAKAQSDPRVTAGDTYSATGQEYGLQSARVMTLFKQEFAAKGADPNRAKGFLNSQGANQWFVDQSKGAISRVYGAGAIDQLFNYQGISFYPDDNLTSATSVDQIFSTLYTDLTRQKQYLQNDANDAAASGLHEAIYEWGPNGFLTQSGITLTMLNQFRADPRAEQWVVDEYHAIQSIIGNDPKSMAMEFTVLGDGWSTQIDPFGPIEQEQKGIISLAAPSTPEPTGLTALAVAVVLLRRRR